MLEYMYLSVEQKKKKHDNYFVALIEVQRKPRFK